MHDRRRFSRRSRLVGSLCALALAIPAAAQVRAYDHPDGTTHWYLAVPTPGGTDWEQARRIAAAAGGYLATLTSSGENDFVFGIVDQPEFWTQTPAGWLGPWLGAVQWPGSAEPAGGWEWAELEPMTFTAWTPGQPDDAGRADRVVFGGAAGQRVATWADVHRGSRQPGFVVEFSGPGVLKTVGLIDSSGPTVDGYTLFNPLRSGATFLVDSRGRPVKSWQSQYTPGTGIYLLPSGNLLRSGNVGTGTFRVGGAGGIVEEFDWQGNVVWQFTHSTADYRLHHDLEPLPNGNVLMIAWELKSANEAIAAGRDPALLSDGELWPDKIIEVDRGGSIVWEWHAWDHLIQDHDPAMANFGAVEDHPELIDVNYAINGGESDWMHSNSVAYNPTLDQVMLGVRSFEELWVIDHSTTTAEAAGHSGGRSGKGGDILYRWGNPVAYRAGDPSDKQLFKQHDCHWIADGLPGAGNILVFNNGTDRPAGEFSTVVEIAPPAIDPASGTYARAAAAFGPAAPAGTFTASPPERFFSQFVSGAQRLPSGNTLVCGGWIGTILEVTPAGEIVWVYVNPWSDDAAASQGEVVGGNQMFRSPHYLPSFPGLAGKPLTPRDPIETYTSILLADGAPAPREVPPGGRVAFTLKADSGAGQFYLAGTSLTPGLTPIDFRFIRSGIDEIFTASITNLAPSTFLSYSGVLDGNGRATAELVIPPFQFLVGIELYTTFLTIDPRARSNIGLISNTATVRVVN